MAQILVRNLSEKSVERLKARAAEHGRSLQAEAKEILEEASEQLTIAEFRREAAEWRRKNGPQTSDSVDLIREDRER